jgi:hypothetical protein
MRRFSVPFFAAVLIAVATLVAAAAPAPAASPKLLLTDPAGDALDARPSMDIVNLSFEVKKVKPTDPKPSLIIAMELAAPPEKQLVSYDVWATIPECGSFNATYAPGTVLSANPNGPSPPSTVFICNGSSSETDSLDLHHPKFSITKNTLTWTIALDYFSKQAREGGTLTEIRGQTQFAEPLTGIMGNAALGLPTDDVLTDKEFAFV